MTSGYYNILAHDNTKEHQDSQRQKRIVNEIKGQRFPQKNPMTPLTPDNNIVFINRDSIIRRPKEFKTPPPPMYGEEEDYPYDKPIPQHEFYDPINDPHKKKFDFLDSREGSVSSHYKNYISSKTYNKPKKIRKVNKNDSLTDSEQNDTIDELPGMDVQNKRSIYPTPYKNTFRASLNRAASHSPTTKKIHNNMHNQSSKDYSHRTDSAFKFSAPRIMAQTMYKPNQIIQNSSFNNMNQKPALLPNSRREIRSGAFQRINSVNRYSRKS